MRSEDEPFMHCLIALLLILAVVTGVTLIITSAARLAIPDDRPAVYYPTPGLRTPTRKGDMPHD